MKSVKIAGVRLVNYINDGINWKDHKDIILDFWVATKSRNYGFHPSQFRNMYLVEELPLDAQEIYAQWFSSFNFQEETDKQWLDFVDGTLNVFYHTSNPTLLRDDIWYIDLMKSEIKARDIVENQLYHGNPNVNSFWKIDTNSKPEEVGGRRNGYMFTRELSSIGPSDVRGFFWAVAFQCTETVKLYYNDKNTIRSKCINWAANAKNMTLIKVSESGRLIVQQVFVKGKAWKDDRMVPQSNLPNTPLSGSALNKWIYQNYYNMYGIWDSIDESKKYIREQANQRKNAVNTMNDEEIKIGRLIPDIETFIARGNISRERRERNKTVRQAIREKNQLREREIKRKMRELEKEQNRQQRRERNKLNPLTNRM